MRRRMAENSISGAGKSSMPAARGQRAGQATRRGFSSQLHWSLPSFQHGVGRGEPTQAHSTERGAMAAPGARDGATWYAATTVAAPQRPPLVQDADVDVCVIGGGLAGLTIAREVVRRGWSAVVLEADKIAWSASGRNAGLAAAEQAGARIFEDTRALAIDSAGVRKRIDTPKGRVRAGSVVLAGGAQLGSVFRAVSETILPVSSYMGVTARLGEALVEAVRYR